MKNFDIYRSKYHFWKKSYIGNIYRLHIPEKILKILPWSINIIIIVIRLCFKKNLIFQLLTFMIGYYVISLWCSKIDSANLGDILTRENYYVWVFLKSWIPIKLNLAIAIWILVNIKQEFFILLEIWFFGTLLSSQTFFFQSLTTQFKEYGSLMYL